MAGLLAAVALAAPAAAAWEPSTFELYCGSPHYTKLTAGLLPASLGGQHPMSFQLYLDELGNDIDDPGQPDCVADGRKRLIEEWAGEILGIYEGMHFESPVPNRLGPVVLDAGGRRVTRIFAAEGADAPHYAATVHPCRGGKMVPEILSIMAVNAHVADVHPTPNLYRLFAHEYLHVMQNASSLKNGALTDDCMIVDWLTEGMADAMSVHLMDRRFRYRPPLAVRGSKSIYGLRPYNKAFTWHDTSERDSYGNIVIPQYRTSSFWMYLADRFFNGKYDYMARFQSHSDFEPDGDDWLKWLDTLLRDDNGGIDEPFYLLFPDFIADFAEWGSKKYKHIGDDDWLADAFGGCHTLALSPGAPPEKLELEMEPISAQCFKVLVGGLGAGEAARVDVMAYGRGISEMDNFHLAAVRLDGTAKNIGRPFSCYDEHKARPKADLCQAMPFMGKKQSGGSGSLGTGEWVKTWLTDEQQGSGTLENLYVIVHSPVYPRDSQHANRTKQKVRLEVGLMTTRMASSTGGAAKAADSDINSLNNTDPVPMTGGEGLGGMVAAAGGGADAISKMPFLANMMMPDFGEMAGGGLAMVNVKQLGAGGSGGSGYDAEQMFMLYLEKPAPYGATGSFPAFIGGSTDPGGNALKSGGLSLQGLAGALGGGIANDGEQPSAVVTIEQWDDQLLKLRIQGRYCTTADVDFRSRKCRRTETFNAEITKPFGWVYDPDQTFTSYDSPGIAEYREHISKRMNAMSPGLVPVFRKQQDVLPGDEPAGDGGDASAGGSGTGGESSGGTVEQPCDCTCEGKKKFTEEVEAAKGAPLGQMAAYLRCAMQCAQQWANCSG